MAVFSALKNKVKPKATATKSVAKKAPVRKAQAKKSAVIKKAAPAKKVVAKKAAIVKKSTPVKKAVVKKPPVKKVALKKPAPIKKIELKKILSAKDVQRIVDVKNAVLRQSEVLAELEVRGVTSINRIPKKVDKDLVDEARALANLVPVLVEKLRKSGLGSPSRILKKAEYLLIAPKPEPIKLEAAKVETDAGKVVVTKIDGEEVELEEVELEDVETLIKEVVEIIDSEVEDKGNQPRVVDLSDEATQGKEEDAFTLKASEEDDAPVQTVMTAGATADPVKDYLKQIGRVALLNAELEVELATRVEVEEE